MHDLIKNSWSHILGNIWTTILGVLKCESSKYDRMILLIVILLMIPTVFEQISAHLSPEFSSYTDAPNFSADWGITEWFISYDGGFVRRGLSGEVIIFFSYLLNVPPNYIIVGFVIIFYILVLILTVQICGKFIPLYFILSPFLLGAPIFAGTLTRKDMLIAFMFICSLKVITSRFSMPVQFVLLSIIFSIAILTHEAFFFLCVPMLVLFYSYSNYSKLFTIDSILLSIVSVSLMTVVTIYKGGMKVAQAIIDQWNSMSLLIAPEYCCLDEPIGMLGAIAFDMNWHMGINKFYWTYFVHGFLYTPLIWITIWVICGLLIARFIKYYDFGSEITFLKFYVIQTIFAFPLFIIAWDYGRWISLISILSFVSTYALREVKVLPSIMKIKLIPIGKNSMKFWKKISIVTLLGVPHLWNDIEFQLRAIPLLDFILYF